VARFAVVDGDGLVVNVVVWDGSNGWQPPEGVTAVLLDGAGVVPPVAERARGEADRGLSDAAIARLPAHVSPGGRYVDGVYIPPPDQDD
jgi:hypothetical protein